MKWRHQFRWLWLIGIGLLFSLAAQAVESDNGRGRHKQLYAVPCPGPVVIDGKLNDWDLSGQIEMFVIEATRATQSGKFALMYDAQALYVSGDINDTTPMMNRHDPKVAPHEAWNADSCQFRLTVDPAVGYPINESQFTYKGANAKKDTRDDIVHLLLWHYTDTAEANLQMHLGMGYRAPRPDWGPHGLVPQAHFTGKYLKRPDGTGYSFEYRIPWATLGAQRPLHGNDIVAGTVQINWSTPDGLKTGGGGAWAYDIMSQPGFAFQSTACWGKIIFSGTGNVPRELVTAGVPPERPLPLQFSYDLPEDTECTIQLFDKQGKSVRILVPQQQRPGGKNIERWDGLDAQGKLLPAGEYVWKGIYHAPIKAQYRFSVHNSGTPAYPTDTDKGGWGGDHGTPQAACALDDGMLLSWNACEYGWGIIRVDRNGKKLWGSKYNALHMATDGIRVYIAGGGGFHTSPHVQLLDVKDSRPSRFANGVATVVAPPGGDATTNEVSGLAYQNGVLYVAYAKRNLVTGVDTTTGVLKARWEVPAPERLAVRPDGTLAVISKGTVLAVAKDGTVTPWLTTHLNEPVAITVAADGTVYVANQGALQNVSVFAADGRYLRCIGKAGGRPPKGAYDASGMYMAGGIALDKQGRLWVAETTDGPKRVSVWDTTTGANLREFFGGSSYFAYGCIDPARPNEILAHYVLWEIDWEIYTTRPLTTIWRPTAPNMLPAPGPDAYTSVPRIITAKNGQQYMWGKSWPVSILLRRDGDLFKPFAAILRFDAQGRAGAGIQMPVDAAGRFVVGTYLWQDGNDDQIVQPDELSLFPARGFERAQCVWMAPDLTVRLSTGHILRPQHIAANGQPQYDVAQLEATPLVAQSTARDFFMQDAEGYTYTLNETDNGQLTCWTPEGQHRWSYPGIVRWKAALDLPVAKAGRLHGMTGAMGVAGDYLAHQTYFGMNHLFRRDGVYVGGILRDGRTGSRGPDESQPEGQGGNFVKLTLDGRERYFVIHGGQDTRVWEVLGLDTVHNLPGGVYVHTETHVTQAKAALEAYTDASSNKKLVVVRGRPALELAEPVSKQLEDGRGFEARMAYDAEHLYVHFDVTTPYELRNATADPQIIFRGGNLLDIQLATDPQADPARTTPAVGDLRLLVTRQQGKPLAVLYRPKVKANAEAPIVLTSPTGTESFDRIAVLDTVRLDYRKTKTGFTAVVTIPQALIGLALAPGQAVKYDLGYIFGNAEGTRTAVRAYLHNRSFSANVVDDIPHESRLEPARWGSATIE